LAGRLRRPPHRHGRRWLISTASTSASSARSFSARASASPRAVSFTAATASSTPGWLSSAATAATTPGDTGAFFTTTRAPRCAVTDHDDPAEAMVTVTAGTGAARRGDPAGALARAGAPDEPRSGVVSDGDRMDALTPDLPAPSRPDALKGGATGDPSERRVRGDDGVCFTTGDAGGAAPRPLPTIDNSRGEKPSASVTPAILTRTVMNSPPSVLGSPTCSTVPIVPVGNCGPDTRTRGRRPAATSSRSWTTCSSASSVSRCAAMPPTPPNLPCGSLPAATVATLEHQGRATSTRTESRRPHPPGSSATARRPASCGVQRLLRYARVSRGSAPPRPDRLGGSWWTARGPRWCHAGGPVTRRRRRRAGTAPGADRTRSGLPHTVGMRDAPSARERSISAARGAPSGTDRRVASVDTGRDHAAGVVTHRDLTGAVIAESRTRTGGVASRCYARRVGRSLATVAKQRAA
jgi:hypothetical protein